MSNIKYMPLTGALLISNPRKEPEIMALALTNGVRKVANRIARMIAAEASGRARSNPKGGLNLKRRADHDTIAARAQQLAAEWASVKDMPATSRPAKWRRTGGTDVIKHITSGAARQSSASDRALLSAAHRAAMTALKQTYGGGRGFIKRQAGAKGGRYKSSAKYTKIDKKVFGHVRSVRARNVAGVQSANAGRVGRRSSNANFDAATHSYREKPIGYWTKAGAGASGQLLLEKGWVTAGQRYKRKGRKGVGKGAKRSAAQLANDAKLSKIAQLRKVVRKATGASTKGMSVEDLKAAARAHGGYSNNNPGVFGGLALTNPGVFGGLALTNGPFVVAGVSAVKLIGTGAAAALTLAAASSYVDEYLPKVPVIGEYLSNLTVPAAVPLIGGITLNNTVAGTLIGGLTIGLSQFIGRKIGSHQVIQYGSAIGTGILLIGPALDISAGGAGGVHGISSEELGGLALDNYGGIAVDNTGAYGDGMAYQLGAISGGDDYGQASLGDAYYSGADFDGAEGQAMLQGRDSFLREFGAAPHRIDQHGGRAGGASHLAGRAGHRWGWLVKMIGWQNAEKIAALPPKQRVRVLKGLRENALATFKQLTQQEVASTLAPDEFAAIPTAGGAEGVSGAHSSYGSTIFGGQGL